MTLASTAIAGTAPDDRLQGDLTVYPTRLDPPLVFPADRGGVLDLGNWRQRVWAPAVETAGVARPARIHDLRSTFASRALAAGVAPFELFRVVGASVGTIDPA